GCGCSETSERPEFVESVSPCVLADRWVAATSEFRKVGCAHEGSRPLDAGRLDDSQDLQPALSGGQHKLLSWRLVRDVHLSGCEVAFGSGFDRRWCDASHG